MGKEDRVGRSILAAAALAAGLISEPSALAQPRPREQIIYSFERSQRHSQLKEMLRTSRQRPEVMHAQLTGNPLSFEASRQQWASLYSRLVEHLTQRIEVGAVQVGSETLGVALGMFAPGNRNDSFAVPEDTFIAFMNAFKELHTRAAAEEKFSVCIVHTHPREIPGVGISPIRSLPPSAEDLKGVVDASLAEEFSEYVGRIVRYREAVVDSLGMWVFERSAQENGDATSELSAATAPEIAHAQRAWAMYVNTHPGLSHEYLLRSTEYKNVQRVYARFGVVVRYYSHEAARNMPLCVSPVSR